ncbi:hypothetical protein JCM10908_003836 [Rhodotorula pacifica]|uniref:uncharacterized protein n=1 Tax=Rhodotorula pacifica TaxID=1495444 RepID=UPI003178E7B3
MRPSSTTISVLVLATVALAHVQPDLVPRSNSDLPHGVAQSRMRLRHKRQLGFGGLVNGLTGGGAGGQSAASASNAVGGGAAQQETSANAAASTSAPAVASTQPAATSSQAATSADTASSSSSAQANTSSAPTQATASSAADETSSAAQTSATSTQGSSSSAEATSSTSSAVSSRVTKTIVASPETSTVDAASSATDASQSSSGLSSSGSSSASSSAASASGSNAALNSSDSKSSSSSSGGLPKPALIAIIVVGSVLVGALVIWYIIRKTALSPSKRFEKRLRSELDFAPSPTDPDLNNHSSYEADDAHLVPGTLAHARNISGMSDDRPFGMAGQGVAPGYAPSLSRSDLGKNSLVGTPQTSEGLHSMPVMPYSGPQYIQQPYYGAPTSPPLGPGYPQEQAYAFGELHRAGSSGSLRPVSPAMQIPYQSPTAPQMSYEQHSGGLNRMPTITLNDMATVPAGDYGLEYRPDSRAHHQQHY